MGGIFAALSAYKTFLAGVRALDHRLVLWGCLGLLLLIVELTLWPMAVLSMELTMLRLVELYCLILDV